MVTARERRAIGMRLVSVAMVGVFSAGGVGSGVEPSRPLLGSMAASPETIALIRSGYGPEAPCSQCADPAPKAIELLGPLLEAGTDLSGPAGLGGDQELSFNDLLAEAMAAEGLTYIGGGASQEELFRRLVAWQEGNAVDADVGALDPEEMGDDWIQPPAAAPMTGANASGLINPVPGADLFDSFGFPRSGGRRHKGIDIFAPEGTPVVAARGGIVVQVRGPGARPEGELGGRTVTIAGDDGRFYYYAHHRENLVAEGDRVAQGEQIGLVGRTGNARTTAPHLHLGISEGGSSFSESRAVNPYPLLIGGEASTPPPTSGPAGQPSVPTTAQAGTDQPRPTGTPGTTTASPPSGPGPTQSDIDHDPAVAHLGDVDIGRAPVNRIDLGPCRAALRGPGVGAERLARLGNPGVDQLRTSGTCRSKEDH